ncbi:MAG TPA: response regulator [Leptolyngbyaceae cyanobacterium]
MISRSKNFTILLANDDDDQCFLIKEALQEVELTINLYFVKDGEQLLDYLYHRADYQAPSTSPRPHLILLDLNMPGISGLEALPVIKSDTNLRPIPIVILTTSHQKGDIFRAYDLGANSFIAKPVTFEGLVEVMKSLCHYWFDVVSLIYST